MLEAKTWVLSRNDLRPGSTEFEWRDRKLSIEALMEVARVPILLTESRGESSRKLSELGAVE
jgi:hypothetical protein